MVLTVASDSATLQRAQRTAKIWLVSHSSALRGALSRRLRTGSAKGEAIAEFQDPDGVAGGPPPHMVVLDGEVTGRHTADVLRHVATAWPRTQLVLLADDRQSLSGTSALPRSAVVLRHSGSSTLAMRKAADDILALLPHTAAPATAGRLSRGGFSALVVASSTGGPDALRVVFSDLSPNDVRVPVLIVQHMPPTFTPMLAAQLRELGWPAEEGQHGDVPAPGTITIAPGGRHMELCGQPGSLKLKLTDDAPINYCKPSADVLFASTAAALGSAVLALVLTGMGSDGGEGAKVITSVGGSVLAQDKASSVVWGMPGAVVQGGAAHKVSALPQVGSTLRSALAAGRL